MTDNNRIRKGSLQFYPRVRAKKIIPNVNWKKLSKKEIGILGFIGYKVGMASIYAKDNTPDSLSKSKRIVIPATVIECPPMKIFSVRFYKNGRSIKEFIVSNDKNLKKKVKIPKKEIKSDFDSVKDYDDLRVILFSEIFETGIGKKKPDFLETAISGSLDEKISFIKERIGKEISIDEAFLPGTLVDTRAVTRGFGTSGPVKRFGISLKSHKSEKGRRRPGSLAPWHPARVTFRAPMAGQLGFQTRVSYNNLILDVGKISEKNINKNGGFDHYGVIKTKYLILKGSVPGPKKRGIVLTTALRPTKKQEKKKFEVIEIR